MPPHDTVDPDGTRPASRRAGHAVPSRVGPHRVEGELGRGGMGVVYRAFDERLQRPVALKALPAGLARDPEERMRLEHEARALACVRHPNVATIHGIEDDGRTIYLVLELVEGRTLRDRIDGGELALADALELCHEIARGLLAVHRRGLVHRDLKPGNVMVTEDGAKILDFGLALPAASANATDVAGTHGYMSPEQLRGEPLDARSDVFAWGCVLHECLTGEAPFPGRTSADRDAATLGREPDWSRIPQGAPESLKALLRTCLAKDRDERPDSMAEVLRRLEDRRDLASRTRPRSLPAARDAFVGRAKDLAELEKRFLRESARLVSVLGLGGLGKTRIAVQFAWTHLDAWPGGTWFCELSEARSADGIVHAVAAALDVPLGKDDAAAQVGNAIAGRGRCLVLLDNFEQVVRHAGETLGRWLDRCPEAQFLVTTREVLGLTGEQLVALPPLPPDEAVALFEARAGAREAERDVVSQVVRLLDGLPLAIELAAARMRVMPARQVLARMGERFRLLASGGTRRDRQATLRSTLDWSWDLLSETERSALAQLSVFQGPFTLDAVEAVVDLAAFEGAPWTVDVAQALLDKSLLRRADDERLGMLVSVQEYASEKLVAEDAFRGAGPDLCRAAEERHGGHFARLGADEALEALDSHDGAARWRQLADDLENLVAACRLAVRRQDADVAARACLASCAVIELRGPLQLGIDLVESVLALHALTPQIRTALVLAAGRCRHHAGQVAEALALDEEALSLSRAQGDRRREAAALLELGMIHQEQGRMGAARECFEAAIAIHRERADTRRESAALNALGLLHWEQGRPEEARACFEPALRELRGRASRRLEGMILGNLGMVHVEQGRLDEARTCYEAALEAHREVGNRRVEALLLINTANLLQRSNLRADARRHYVRALAACREIGDRRAEGAVLANLGVLLTEDGERDEALQCYESALALHREVRDRRFEGITLSNLAVEYAARGRLDDAADCTAAALDLHRAIGHRRPEGLALGDLGHFAMQRGHFDEARRCFAEADAALHPTDDLEALAIVACQRAENEHLAGDHAAAIGALAKAERLASDLAPQPSSRLIRMLRRVGALLREAAT